MKPIAASCSLLLALWAWTPPATAETTAEAEVRQAMTEVITAASNLDAAGILSRLDSSSASRFFVQGQSFNHADLATFLLQAFADMKSQQVIWLESAARELSPDTVLWTSSGRNPVVEASGREVEYMLAETWMWKKLNDQWKAIHYHESFLEMPSREARARVETALLQFAASFTLPAAAADEAYPQLEGFVTANPAILGAAFATTSPGETRWPAIYAFRKGADLIRKNLPFDAEYTKAEWYAKPLSGVSPAWTNPYFDASGAERMMITCSVLVRDSDGKPQGILTADLPIY